MPSLKQMSDHLDDNPEDWEAVKTHYEPSLAAADNDASSLWTSWEEELTSTEVRVPMFDPSPSKLIN